MKKLLIFGLFLVLIGAVAIPSFQTLKIQKTNEITSNNITYLWGYWSFDEGTGDILHDISANENNAKIDDASWDNAGIVNGALDFDGNDDFVLFDNKLIPQGEKTISAWIKPRSDNHQWNSHSIIGNGNMNKNYAGFDLYYRDDQQDIYAWIHQDGDYIVKINSTDGAIEQDEWNFVVFSWDGTKNSDGVKLYINGELDTSNTAIENSEQTADFNTVIGYRANIFDHNDRYWFNGLIDEIRVYDTALQDEVIQNLYTNPSNLKKLVLFGKIKNLNADTNSLITFKAEKLRIISFSPFQINKYLDDEHVIISEDYIGILNPDFILSYVKMDR